MQLFQNSITEIRRDQWIGLESLEELNLDFNEISSIEDGSFRNLNNLVSLDLRKNQLTAVRWVIIKKKKKIHKFQ